MTSGSLVSFLVSAKSFHTILSLFPPLLFFSPHPHHAALSFSSSAFLSSPFLQLSSIYKPLLLFAFFKAFPGLCELLQTAQSSSSVQLTHPPSGFSSYPSDEMALQATCQGLNPTALSCSPGPCAPLSPKSSEHLIRAVPAPPRVPPGLGDTAGSGFPPLTTPRLLTASASHGQSPSPQVLSEHYFSRHTPTGVSSIS